MDCDLEDVQVNRPFSPVPNLLVHAELNLLHIFLSSLNSLKKALASLYRLLFISSSSGYTKFKQTKLKFIFDLTMTHILTKFRST